MLKMYIFTFFLLTTLHVYMNEFWPVVGHFLLFQTIFPVHYVFKAIWQCDIIKKLRF